MTQFFWIPKYALHGMEEPKQRKQIFIGVAKRKK
jgi:hypothetical protein